MISNATFYSRIDAALANPRLQAAVRNATYRMASGRTTAVSAFPEMDAVRDHARAIRAHTIARLDHYLRTFADNVERRGGHVHFAVTAEDAVRIVCDIAAEHHVKTIVKGKSMVSEEVHLNEGLEKWGLEPWQVLVLMQITYLIMGTFLDDTAMLIIVAPLYIPLIIALGFNPIWYGVLYVITCQIAYITPPFGYNLFLMRAMAPKDVTLIDIYRSIIPFVILMVLGLGLVIVFPEIALWLPNQVYGAK